MTAQVAQRGPGLASRQRVCPPATPGPLPSAQRGPGLASRQRTTQRSRKLPGSPSALNEGRDSRPGNGARIGECAQRVTPLNEGRDSRPGNGLADAGSFLLRLIRSTRAGTRVPATGPQTGDTTAAGASRSTRAGTRVPATVPRACVCRMVRPALNEGRDSRPGNGQHPQPVTLPQNRSTRAGTRVPATERETPGMGRVGIAQRGPGLASRQRSWLRFRDP